MIGAGQVWPIAAAWVDGIAAGLEKNSPRMHDVINSPLSAKSPLKTMASGRLPKTSGFQVDSGVSAYIAGRLSRGHAVPAFILQNAHGK
jgi:hypothetical protein